MRSIVAFPFFIAVLSQTVIAAGTLSVQEAVRRGLSAHPQVQAANAMIQAAEGERLSALSPESPTISVEYEGIPGGEGLSQYSERRVTVSQGFEFPLRYIWHASASRSGVDRSRQEALGALLDLEALIRNAFTEAWAMDEKVGILKENVEAARITTSQLERLVELGERAPLEARHVKVDYLQAKANLDAALGDQIALRSRLGHLIGTPIDKTTLEVPLFAKASESSANPEIVAAVERVDKSEAELRLAKTAWLPELEFSYFHQKQRMAIDPLFWGVEVGFSVPLWFWLGGRGEIGTASAERRASVAELANLLIETASEVDRLTQIIKTLEAQRQIYDGEVVPASKETYELAVRSYQMGEANYLQVLDAQRSALEIELEFVEIESQLAVSITKLDRLSGQTIVGLEELENLLNGGK